jgi:hypothetical protein
MSSRNLAILKASKSTYSDGVGLYLSYIVFLSVKAFTRRNAPKIAVFPTSFRIREPILTMKSIIVKVISE